jgi:hypothetical protein
LMLHTHCNDALHQRHALQIGAKYVVITTKHHDGFCLWPTKVQNPHKTNYSSERDLVGDLAEAVRARSECFWEEEEAAPPQKCEYPGGCGSASTTPGGSTGR